MQYVFEFLSLGRKFLAVGSCPVHCAPWLRLLKSLFPRNLERAQGATCIQAEDRASHFAANMFDSDTPTVFSFNTVWFNDIYDNYFIPVITLFPNSPQQGVSMFFPPNELLPTYLYFRRTIFPFFPPPRGFFSRSSCHNEASKQAGGQAGRRAGQGKARQGKPGKPALYIIIYIYGY